ncbi:hypothetical protein CUMW_183360 [Citrus unshiu]|uniref:Uncharacterized protein n=1 Tax=Citrus unshiu TaxID=55188 RepID=A0A2H5PZY7_CITUN|nr:hypothetical protein CUMW_183360 [Citrus unshiu]
MEKELEKIEFKNEFRDAKLGGSSLFYRYTKYIITIGLKTFWTLRIVPHHRSTDFDYPEFKSDVRFAV